MYLQKKSKTPIYFLVGAFFIFFCTLSGYNMLWDQDYGKQARSMQSKNKSTKSVDSRDLILGNITETQTEVANEPSALFNDPAIKQAWGLKKSDAARAWSVSRGSKDVIVAVIDTGIDTHHEDIKNNLWVNTGEMGTDAKGRDKSTNGIDDDGNGFIDDVNGWNFVSNNNKLDDNHGHGTHIACIIGAEAGNKKGIIGISPDVSVMVLKYFDPKVPNTDNLKNTIAAIKYAVKMGAHIINYSGGGTDFSQEEHDAIAEAEKKGILFVAAAGNERSNSDENHYYPADYKLKNIISVTAIDQGTEVLPSSNYGTETVDIAAPGQGILSCLPHNTYGPLTGTSQATAFVTGGAVLVMSNKHLQGQADEVRKFLLATGDVATSLQGKTRTARQLNLFKSLTMLESNVAISGVRADIPDRTMISSKGVETFDPNMSQTKNINEIKSFGQGLIKIIGSKPGKPTPATRLGDTQQESN